VLSELPSSTRMRVSTQLGISATVARSVFSALYAGNTTATFLPFSIVEVKLKDHRGCQFKPSARVQIPEQNQP